MDYVLLGLVAMHPPVRMMLRFRVKSLGFLGFIGLEYSGL
jgi:hypothetical protein